jgi:molybdate transport system ATP-binding protein
MQHRFATVALDIAFDVRAPGVTVLFGPSASGKSTIINATAGLLRPDACRVAIRGTVLAGIRSGIWLSPERREAGVVFQDLQLLPHMSVATNLRFGMRRVASGTVRFDDVIDLLGLPRCCTGARIHCPEASVSVWRSDGRCWRSRICC